jgi:hypothetical protein
VDRAHTYRIYATNQKTRDKDWFEVQYVAESNATTDHFNQVLAQQGHPEFTVDEFEILRGPSSASAAVGWAAGVRGEPGAAALTTTPCAQVCLGVSVAARRRSGLDEGDHQWKRTPTESPTTSEHTTAPACSRSPTRCTWSHFTWLQSWTS